MAEREISPNKIIKFARNGEIFSSRTEVLETIPNSKFPSNVEVDGMPLLFRYSGGTKNDETIHTALVILYGSGNQPTNASVFEDDNLENVIINNVSGVISDTNGVILATINLSGDNINVGTYVPIVYPVEGLNNVSGTQKINEAFSVVEHNISANSQTIEDIKEQLSTDEYVLSKAISDICKYTGLLDEDTVIYSPYIHSPNIGDAPNLSSALNLLDQAVQVLQQKIEKLDCGEY